MEAGGWRRQRGGIPSWSRRRPTPLLPFPFRTMQILAYNEGMSMENRNKIIEDGSGKNQADGGRGRNVAGGPVGGWLGVTQPIRAETGAGGLLHTPIAEQNIAEPGSVARRMHLPGPRNRAGDWDGHGVSFAPFGGEAVFRTRHVCSPNASSRTKKQGRSLGWPRRFLCPFWGRSRIRNPARFRRPNCDHHLGLTEDNCRLRSHRQSKTREC